jgi:hypothetical protein
VLRCRCLAGLLLVGKFSAARRYARERMNLTEKKGLSPALFLRPVKPLN